MAVPAAFYAARIRLEPHGGNKALVVLASIYYPGDRLRDLQGRGAANRSKYWEAAVGFLEAANEAKMESPKQNTSVAGTWRTVAQQAMPAAVYWLVLSLITFLGMSEVIKIEATGTRLSLAVVVVGVAFSSACFLERLLRDRVRTDEQPNPELSDVTGGLPKWLNRNKEQERCAEPQTGAKQAQEGLWCWLPS
jgi:hypothetical protein